jgi:hypothetical protein
MGHVWQQMRETSNSEEPTLAELAAELRHLKLPTDESKEALQARMYNRGLGLGLGLKKLWEFRKRAIMARATVRAR